MLTTIVLIVVVAALVGLASTLYLGQNALSSPVPAIAFMQSPPSSFGPTASPNPSSVQLPFVSLGNSVGQPDTFGCGDSIVFIESNTSKTDLKSAFEELFNLSDSDVDQNLYNALSNSDLELDRLDQSADSTKIYLTGELSLSGVCDNPRVGQQLIQTATLNSTADNIEIFINDMSLDETLSLNVGR